MKVPRYVVLAIIVLCIALKVTQGTTLPPPHLCPLEDGTSLDLVLSAFHEAAHLGIGSNFRVLQAFVDAASTTCTGPLFLYGTTSGQTMFAPTDEAFEELFVILNRGLEELLSNPTFLCNLVAYHLTIPCGETNSALYRRSCGFLLTSDMIDGQAFETMFNDPALTSSLGLAGSGTASSLLFAQISQEVSLRKVRVDGYMKRGADLHVPNIVLCGDYGSGLAVHIVNAVLVPAAAFYSTVESLIASLPELSITAEAYFLTRAFRTSFPAGGVVSERQGVSAQQNIIIIPPLIPRGFLPNPVLPDEGMCVPGEIIDALNMQTVFAPTNLAWKNFFRRVGLSKEQVFSDPELLLSTLQYSEVFIDLETTPISADGELAGSRYFTYNMYPLEFLQTAINPELLFVTPLLGPTIGTLNFFDLIVDITCIGNKRIITLEGQRFAFLGGNKAVILTPDLVACDGLLHIVDSVLITPGLTTLRQLTLRPELSLFTQIVTSPGNEILALELDTVGTAGQLVSGIAIFAPTNAAVEGTLGYLGYRFEEIIVPLMDPFIAFLIRQQLAQYHLILDLVPRGVLVPQEDFRLCLLADTDVFDTRLAYPILAKPCNLFLGLSIIRQVGIRIQGVRSLTHRIPPGLPDVARAVFVEGRLNGAKVIVPDLVSSNGVVQVVDTMLVPPTAELGLTILDRIERTPWLKVYEEIVKILGLQGEFRGQCFPPGDASVFAPVDIAFFAFFAKLSLSKAFIIDSFTSLLYDVILFSTVTERLEGIPIFDEGVTENDFVYPPLQPQFLAKGEPLPTTLQRYWQSPAELTFLRHDTLVKGDGSVITQAFVSGGTEHDWFAATNASVLSTASVGYPGALPNVAQIIPPEARSGQLAINGDLHVVDKVLLPDPLAFCRAGDFEFVQGYAFQSLEVPSLNVDPAGQIVNEIVPRALAFAFCEHLPCTYDIPGLYGRAGFRMSVEVVVKFKHLVPLCDPWCTPASFWWCIPCTGIYAQTVLTIGGCAPYQNLHHCGGALSIFVTDAGEVRFGFQTFVESFSLLPIFAGGGMRVVDTSVPAKGFKAVSGQVFKILATYDGLCNCTKIYINDKLRGIADPFDMGQYVWQPFVDVADNFYESITLGGSMHTRNATPPSNVFPGPTEISAGIGGVGGVAPALEAAQASNLYLSKDWSLPAAGQFATYPADPVLVGRYPTQIFLPWKGDILSTSVWFDNGRREGIRYPSTCVRPPFANGEEKRYVRVSVVAFSSHVRAWHCEARASRAHAGKKGGAMDASAWLSDFERVERNVDDAFACLYERDAAQGEGRAADATELTATVRKQAAELRSELDALGASLELSSVTEREKIRREDLVAGLYGRCDELAGLSSADAEYVSSSPPASTNFFQPEPDSHSGETPATVDLDNAGILQLQRNMMMRQDDELDELSRVVSSTKHIGLAVNEELDLHARLLDDIEDEVTRTGSRLKQAHQMALRVYKKTSNCRLAMVSILCLTVLILLVFAVLKHW